MTIDITPEEATKLLEVISYYSDNTYEDCMFGNSPLATIYKKITK